MHAHIFDIDGALLDSCDADADLYAAAVCKVFALESEVLLATQREFVASLEQHIADHGPFREIPGAVSYVSRLLSSPDHYVAYATGGWRGSALLKLASAGRHRTHHLLRRWDLGPAGRARTGLGFRARRRQTRRDHALLWRGPC
jgi:hypothetical protein